MVGSALSLSCASRILPADFGREAAAVELDRDGVAEGNLGWELGTDGTFSDIYLT